MTRPSSDRLTIPGVNNNGRPRQEYADHIALLTDAAFIVHAEQKIWLSAYASSNTRSDYHWQADACYDEAQRRGKPELYSEAHKNAVRSAVG